VRERGRSLGTLDSLPDGGGLLCLDTLPLPPVFSVSLFPVVLPDALSFARSDSLCFLSSSFCFSFAFPSSDLRCEGTAEMR
jgi:hypothetical protein